MADNKTPPTNPNDLISFGDFFGEQQSVPIETEEDRDRESSGAGGHTRDELYERGKEKIKDELGYNRKREELKDTLKDQFGLKKKGAEELGEKVGGNIAKEGVEEGVEKIGEQALKQGVKLGAQVGSKLAVTAGEAAAESSTGVGAVVAAVQVAAAVGDIAVMPAQQLLKGEYSKINESEMVLWGVLSFFMSFLSIIGAFFFLIAFDFWLARSKGSDKSFGITRGLVQLIIGSIPILGLPFCVLGWSIPQHNKVGSDITPLKKNEEQKKSAKPKTLKK